MNELNKKVHKQMLPLIPLIILAAIGATMLIIELIDWIMK